MRALLAVLVVGLGLLGRCVAAEQPNVLFIVADDLRDTLGCYGNTAVKTPNLDRLAARGVRFDRAYVQYPVCNPSRSSFLSGLRPDQTGITDNGTILRDKLPEVVTFPQLLKENGWQSVAFGKIYHLGGGRNEALRRKWMDLPKSWDSAQAFDATATGKRNLAGRNLTEGKLKWCQWAMADGGDDDQADGQNARAAVEFIEQAGAKPWLLAVGFHKPHDPFIAPKKYFDLYPTESLKLYQDPKSMTPAPPLAVGFGDYGKEFAKFTEVERKEFQRAYYAGVSFMDAQVGRVMEALDRRQLWDKTVVIFISDHGYHLGERQWWNKNTLFERSTRAPLIIAAPGVKAGVVKGIVEFVDLYPTITDLCGVKPPPGLAGQSLRPWLRDPARPGKEAAYTIVTRGPNQRGESVRTDRWRFTLWSDGSKELYDHASDPQETSNLAAASGMEKVITELTTKLKTK